MTTKTHGRGHDRGHDMDVHEGTHHGASPIGWIMALLPLALTAYFATLIGPVAEGEVIRFAYEWAPSMDVNLSFYIDGLSLLLALIVSGVGTLIMIYAGGYLAGHPQIGRFYVILTVFMLAMLGVVLADSILTLFIFWELTSISSYLLIGFNHTEEKSRKSAWQALLVTGAGGLALMAGLILMGLVSDSWSLTELLANSEAVRQSALYLPALILVLLGAFTKSAQFPFHFWLPNAMVAPTPVSAYLHSATMVKAGVYLLARLNPIMGGTDAWFMGLVVFGGITAFLGAWLSWQKRDLKAILAYSTMSALGTLVFFIGIGTKVAYETAVLFLLVHSLYKGALFMVAGSVDHETGTRDVTELGGLARLMPLSLVGTVLAALSMSGAPPLLGFLGKELMYETTLDAPRWIGPLTIVILATNALMVTAAAVIAVRPFFGQKTERVTHIHEAPLSMWLGPLLLGGIALGLGSLPALPSEFVVAPGAASLYQQPVEVHLALWHGLTPVLLLSLATWGVGLVVYGLYGRLRAPMNQLDMRISRIGPERWYDWALDGLLWSAEKTTALLQHGYLRYYLLVIVFTSLGLIGYTLFARNALRWPVAAFDARVYEVLIAVVILGAAYMAASVRSRLTAIIALGVVGYGIALIYVLFSAPDLAMTQFSIETLSVILFVLVLYRLPYFARLTRRRERTRDVIVSLMIGALMSTLVLVAIVLPRDLRLTRYFAENSVPVAHGHNIVNVILVDFRGMDTMVEITVLAVAAIGVYALIKLRQDEQGGI